MPLLERFRDREIVNRIVKGIKEHAPKKKVKFCHVCGTHEITISKNGLRDILPDNIEIFAGPGCPVCITPVKEIEEAIWLAENGITLTSFGDMVRVPGINKSLLEIKSEGGDVRIVYSVRDAVRLAEKRPDLEVVFFAIGFETTVPTTALAILNEAPNNFSLLSSHRLIPPAMELMLYLQSMGIDVQIDGFIAPGHVATIIGLRPYNRFPEIYGIPTVIAGFEPVDVIFAIFMLLKQMNQKRPGVDNEYCRVVKPDGNPRALKVMNEVYKVTDGDWRGIGRIPGSALGIREKYVRYDAREKYDISIKVEESKALPPNCICHFIIVGAAYPPECPLYMKSCNPAHPVGPCMVSREGTCNIWSKYRNKKGLSKETKNKILL